MKTVEERKETPEGAGKSITVELKLDVDTTEAVKNVDKLIEHLKKLNAEFAKANSAQEEKTKALEVQVQELSEKLDYETIARFVSGWLSQSLESVEDDTLLSLKQ
ncbi:MAG: hypothetical protein FWG63_03035 [Defluviitaleaceae bacterium]|nr:hypothetical protein [Defluviitaleaceae bacterium]